TPGAEHVLMTINAQDAPVALPLVGARRGLLLTTEHPTKARLRYGDRFDIVWVTEQPEPGVPRSEERRVGKEGRSGWARELSSRRRHTRSKRDWSSDVCSSDLTPGAEHVLMTINAQDAPVALPLVGARRGLLLTTEHPTKARLRYGDRFDIVWVTEQPEPGVPCVRPNALDTEGRRAIGNYAAAHE